MADTYDPTVIGKLLERAGHSRTDDSAALAAVRKASQILDRHGKSLRDVVREDDAIPNGFAGHLNDILEQVKQTEAENQELRQKVSELNNRLVQNNAQSDYAKLRQKILQLRNVGVYWRDFFMSSTGYDAYDMKRWKAEGRVPKEAFEAVDQIDPSKYKRPTIRSWNFKENAMFRRLVLENKSSHQVATAMTREFGRSFSIDGITKKMRALSC